MIINAPISVGELIDKITILEIKKGYASLEQQNNIQKELMHLQRLASNIKINIFDLKSRLLQINLELWHLENFKRKCEQDQQFDHEFVEASRQVYLKNDIRAIIKREINQRCNSDIVEEKIHIIT